MKKHIMTLVAIMLISHIKLFAPPKESINLKNPFIFTFSRATEKTALSIKYTESRGNYHSVGLSGEFGAYQYRPKTWNKLIKRYYSEIKEKYPERDTLIIDIQSARWQDLITKIRIEKLYQKGFDVEQIAAIWNSGSHENWQNKIGVNSFGVNYNVPEYVRKVKSKYNSIPD